MFRQHCHVKSSSADSQVRASLGQNSLLDPELNLSSSFYPSFGLCLPPFHPSVLLNSLNMPHQPFHVLPPFSPSHIWLLWGWVRINVILAILLFSLPPSLNVSFLFPPSHLHPICFWHFSFIFILGLLLLLSCLPSIHLFILSSSFPQHLTSISFFTLSVFLCHVSIC